VGPENLEECATAQQPISLGQRIVSRVDGGRAQIWLEPAEGKALQLTANDRNHWQPRIAPDAGSFVYLSSSAKPDRGRPGSGDYLLAQRQLSDGVERVLAQFYGGAGSLGISPWSADGKRVVFVSREPP
jgi:Tol biopolymer transport system component